VRLIHSTGDLVQRGHLILFVDFIMQIQRVAVAGWQHGDAIPGQCVTQQRAENGLVQENLVRYIHTDRVLEVLIGNQPQEYFLPALQYAELRADGE